MTHAYFERFEVNDKTHTPVTDEITLPKGTNVSSNIRALVDPGDEGNIVVLTVGMPGKTADWNTRTSNDHPLLSGDNECMRFYQTLGVVGDWYFACRVFNHQGGLVGDLPTELEVHVT